MAFFSLKLFIISAENFAAGVVIVECSIKTDDGVKVADVAWASDEFMLRNGEATPYEEAPEICLEIVSSSNSREEMNEKIQLYLAKGAVEVWLCAADGSVTHFAKEGQKIRSTFTKEAVSLKYK